MTASVTRGKDLFGKSEFFFGVSIKPRRVDFDLFHQSAEAENCYGPFNRRSDSTTSPRLAFGGPANDRLIWEGFLDRAGRSWTIPSLKVKDMVLRLDLYVGERDLLGIGFSDNVIFRKQVLPVYPDLRSPARTLPVDQRELHGGQPAAAHDDGRAGGSERLDVGGTGFKGTFQVEFDIVPEEGEPAPMDTAKPPAEGRG